MNLNCATLCLFLEVTMKKISNRWLIVLAAILMIVGGGLLIASSRDINTENEPETASEVATNETSSETEQISQQALAPTNPVRIQVLEADINIPVAQGVYNRSTQKWTLSNDKAHFATMTTMPNQAAGNTFIYGHNRKSVFSRLVGAKPGTTAVVTTENNQRFVYRLRTSYTTTPTDDSILHYSGPPILTLQTCTGAMFQNRTMYVFDFVGVSNA